MASTCSVRPSCSSAPPWPTTAMAKQVTITAAIDSSAAIRVSASAPAPPIRSIISRAAGGVEHGADVGPIDAEHQAQ